MKNPVVLTLLSLVLFSCADHSLETSETRLPVLERHGNLETGEAIAEKSFVYDKANNLIRETYKPLTSKVSGYEYNYEYDDQQNKILVLGRHIYLDVSTYTIAKYIYDGDKLLEEHFYGTDVNAHRPSLKKVYYYSNNQADSLVSFYIPYNANDYVGYTESYFKHDSQGRLIEEQVPSYGGGRHVVKLNNYDGELLESTCNPATGEEGGFNCTRYEYNAQKNVIRKYATLTGTADRLLEEHAYAEGLLTETKIFDWRYTFPAYQADPTPYTLVIKYEY